MATILKNKKSTTGSPYVYYTVDATPSDRTATSVKIAVKITSHLAETSSTLGATYDLTCYLTFNGTEYSIKIKDNESWSGTTKHTKTKKITVKNLSPSASVIENITFRALGYNDSSDRAGYTTKTACSDLTIPIGHVNPTDAYFTIEEAEPSLIEAGIPNDLFVANLSNKKFTVGATFYDDATMQKVWILNQSISTRTTINSNDNPAIGYFNFQEKIMRRGYNGIEPNKVPIRIAIYDSLDGAISLPPQTSTQSDYFYDFAYYDKLLLNEQTSKVRRFGQTTGNVRANLYGQFFRGVLGNKDQTGTYKPTIKYKIWSGNEEPTTYNYTIPSDNITTKTEYVQASGVYQDTIYYYKLVNGNYETLIYEVDYYVGDPIEDEVYTLNHSFEVEDYEIGSNVETDVNYFNPELSYKVKFQLSDNFTTYESLEKTINVGKATWTEYRDRVDFEKITVKGKEIKENNVITTGISSSSTISNTNEMKVNFNKSVSVGNKLTLSNGMVLIGKDVSKVKVSSQCYFSGNLTRGDRISINLMKNYNFTDSTYEQQISTSQMVVYGTLGSISTAESVIDVAEGDLICLLARNRTSGTGTIYHVGTYLTVEAI